MGRIKTAGTILCGISGGIIGYISVDANHLLIGILAIILSEVGMAMWMYN